MSTDRIKIMLFQGSPRREDNCPQESGKSKLLTNTLLEKPLPNVDLDFCDLSVGTAPETIRPCKGCVSTAGGFHCHWPCDCYSKDSDAMPDFLHNHDVYGRLERCDGFMIVTPIHWYAATTVVKALFDRLVCASLTLTVEQARKLELGKDPVKTRAAEKSGRYTGMLTNHLAGKFAAFFIHGDNGGADYRELAAKKSPGLLPFPPSLRQYLQSEMEPEGPANQPRQAIMPLVWQCRYSGIFVPDDLVVGMHINAGMTHAEGMEAMNSRANFFDAGTELMKRLAAHIVSQKNNPAA